MKTNFKKIIFTIAPDMKLLLNGLKEEIEIIRTP
jgi:hypothetical protein